MGDIDAHQHFWHPKRGDYPWMPMDDPILARPYHPGDLSDDLDAAGVEATVLVQAAPTVAETDYLLGIADTTPYVAKIVGWIDFEDRSQASVLERLAAHPKFAGVRPMIQDIADDAWMLRDDVQWAYAAIVDLDLTFDCLGFPRHLGRFHTLLTRHPDMRAVIDHCMKPQFRTHSAKSLRAWANGMSALARDTQAFCKLSGLVTEADKAWSDDILAPYADHVVESFGPERVMWGSDWPVARLRCGYGDWHAQARRLTRHFGDAAQNHIFGETARRFYRLHQARPGADEKKQDDHGIA